MLQDKVILVVDDAKAVRTMMAQVLRSSGAHVVEAASVCEAAAWLAMVRPHCIVLDKVMEGGDGADFARELAGNTRSSRIPVILVTAETCGSPRLERMVQEAAGVDTILSKPFALASLVDRVREFASAA